MSKQPLFPSHLFTLRVWHEDSSDGSKAWHGCVQYVYSNDVQAFDDWSALIAYVVDTATRFSAMDDATPCGGDQPA